MLEAAPPKKNDSVCPIMTAIIVLLACIDDNGQPMVLECVREAERRVGGRDFMEYLPMGGSKAFVDISIKLAYGEDCPALAGEVYALTHSGLHNAH